MTPYWSVPESVEFREWGRAQVSRAIIPLLNDLDAPHRHEWWDEAPDWALLWEVWLTGCDAYRIPPPVLRHGVIYFRTEEWVSAARRDPEAFSKHAARYYQPQLLGGIGPLDLTEIAEMYRFDNDV